MISEIKAIFADIIKNTNLLGMALEDRAIMKKLFFLALFAIAAMVASAQNQIDWSVKAGIGMANIMGDNMKSPKVKLAYKIGVGLECPFDEVWSLQTGISFVSKGTNHTIVETDGNIAQAKVNASYLELPVMVAVRFAINRNTHLLVSAGPYGAWGIGGKTKALGYSWSSSSRPDWDGGNVIEMDTFGTDGLDLRRFDYGVGIGLAVEYQRYMIGVDGQLGLCKLHKELNGKNLTGFVTLGYKL